MSDILGNIQTDALGAITGIGGQGLTVFNKIYEKITINNLFKYLIQGLAVAIAAYVIPNRKTSMHEIAVISIVSGLTFLLLDTFTDDIAKYVRLGTGVGIGLGLVNLNTTIPYLANIGV